MTLKTAQETDKLSGSAAEAAQMAIEAGLIYVSDTEPGIRRLRVGRGFRYVTPENRRLEAAKDLKRIASLAIPPAYRDVWISMKPRGHLQATGRDARGRKQYRYHTEWRELRDSAKFERMVAFGEQLSKLRRVLKRDMALPGLPREKVLAVVVSLLDATRIRVGNTEYARDNKSFGLTTLRNRHVTFIRDGRAVLNFRGITLVAVTPPPELPSEHAFKKKIVDVVKQVAAELRNTPAVCRKSYINPAVFDSWRSGSIHENIDGKLTAASARKAETLVLAFLRQEGNVSGAPRRQPVLQRISAQDDRPA